MILRGLILLIIVLLLISHIGYTKDNSADNQLLYTTSNGRSLLNSVMNEIISGSDEKLFYMYDLDEKYWWAWPDIGTNCEKNKYINWHYGNLSGIGPPINLDDGLFLTWHFSMFSALFNRFKRSSRRTRDPEKASLFIIPYDLALDGYTDRKNCLNRNPLRCSSGYVFELQQMLKHNKYFHRHKGADHVVLWSLHQYHALPRSCDGFMMRFCEKCTFTCYWMNYTLTDNRFVSIPFPSAYHWWNGIKNIPWDIANASNRTLKAVYVGSTLTITPYHTKIRRAMTGQCKQEKGCHWSKIFHSSTDTRFVDFVTIYKKAEFCLCPPGDDPGRKAVFDSIVSGCIPVVFHESTIFNQYPWHMGEEISLDISVYIPGTKIISGELDLMTTLNSISPNIIKKKQIAISQIAPKIHYSIPPVQYLYNRSDETKWDPPFKDAADLTLDGMFKRIENVIKNRSTSIPNPIFSSHQWITKYNDIIIQEPTTI